MSARRVIEVGWIEDKLVEIERSIQDLVARKAVYTELLDAATHPDDVSGAARPSAQEDRKGTREREGLEPSTAIDELVETEPGLTRKQVADRLEDKVASTAENVRAVLFTHMRRRENSGAYYKDHNGRLYHKDHPVAREDREQKRRLKEQAESGSRLDKL